MLLLFYKNKKVKDKSKIGLVRRVVMKRTVFITGATDGIGKLTAIKYAKDGHILYIHGRSEEKLAATIKEIYNLTGNEEIKGYLADFSDLKSVMEMANEIKKDLNKVDILINNAGVYNSKSIVNQNGIDLRMIVNYISQYLLTRELMPVLKKGNEARVINLSSAAQAPVSFEILRGEEQTDFGTSYAMSKLALTMWSFDLAKEQTDLIVIPVNPGSLQNTRMVREAYGTSWSSPDKGATILYELGLSESYKKYSGKYYDNDRGAFANAHPMAYDVILVKKLIEVTEEIIGKYLS